MNISQPPANPNLEKVRDHLWLGALLAGVIGLIAISSQSLWIDETLTAAKASAPNFHGWWQAMLADKASDLQMPLYMLYIWGFAKIFGVSEWALRAANLSWFIAGVTAFMAAFPTPKKFGLWFVLLACPFAWYYLDEARPYTLQFSASLVIVAALHRLSSETVPDAREILWVAAFFVGLILLSGSSLLGMIWAGAACLSVPVFFSRARMFTLLRSHLPAAIICAALLLAIGVYYLWTLKVGARASDVGKTDGRNLFFIAYELLGFSGLGPGRLEIRDAGLGAFVPYAKQLAVYGVLVFDLLILGLWQAWRKCSRKIFVGLCAVIAVPVVTILVAGIIEHFRVLGRHFVPLLPVLLAVLWLGLQARCSRRHWSSKPLAAGFVILTLISCLSFRFAPRHAKDDYRDAAAFANSALAAGQVVWWNAAREGAQYYKIALADTPGGPAQAVWLMNPNAAGLARLPAPDIIITSKPDVYDGLAACANYARAGGYAKLLVLPAFIVWQRPAAAQKTAAVSHKIHG